MSWASKYSHPPSCGVFPNNQKNETIFRYLSTKLQVNARKLAQAFRKLDNEDRKEVRNAVRLSAFSDCMGESIKKACAAQG